MQGATPRRNNQPHPQGDRKREKRMTNGKEIRPTTKGKRVEGRERRTEGDETGAGWDTMGGQGEDIRRGCSGNNRVYQEGIQRGVEIEGDNVCLHYTFIKPPGPSRQLLTTTPLKLQCHPRGNHRGILMVEKMVGGRGGSGREKEG